MKKHHTISLILLALLLAVGFTILTHNFPFPGKTSDDFSLITGSSQTYTPEEIQDAAEDLRAGSGTGDLLDFGGAVDREQANAEREGARDVALLLDRVAEGDARGGRAGVERHFDFGDVFKIGRAHV